MREKIRAREDKGEDKGACHLQKRIAEAVLQATGDGPGEVRRAAGVCVKAEVGVRGGRGWVCVEAGMCVEAGVCVEGGGKGAARAWRLG